MIHGGKLIIGFIILEEGNDYIIHKLSITSIYLLYVIYFNLLIKISLFNLLNHSNLIIYKIT